MHGESTHSVSKETIRLATLLENVIQYLKDAWGGLFQWNHVRSYGVFYPRRIELLDRFQTLPCIREAATRTWDPLGLVLAVTNHPESPKLY